MILANICDSCRQPAVTSFVTYHYNFGFLIGRIRGSSEGSYCRDCCLTNYLKYNIINLIGWAGVISLFVAPWLFIKNTSKLFSSLKRASKSFSIDGFKLKDEFELRIISIQKEIDEMKKNLENNKAMTDKGSDNISHQVTGKEDA